MPLIKFWGLLIVFSMICILWLVFTFSNWDNFLFIEVLIVFLLFAFSFLAFFDAEAFPIALVMPNGKEDVFSKYNDQEELVRLQFALTEGQLFMRQKLSLKELAEELTLPSRYVSHLINQYHDTNFRELINSYRVSAFIDKVKNPNEKHKTLLALALESGFNSKSTFNQVIKAQTGNSPSDYLD